MTHRSYKEESRANWGTTGDTINIDQLKVGAVMRIADACELMAKDRKQMERDLRWNTDRHEHYRREAERLARSNAALRGVIKRMKRNKT